MKKRNPATMRRVVAGRGKSSIIQNAIWKDATPPTAPHGYMRIAMPLDWSSKEFGRLKRKEPDRTITLKITYNG